MQNERRPELPENQVAFLRGGGVCGALARSVDWAATPLGPPAGWPAALKTTLSIIFNSRHPMFLWWGPELIQFYNDGYAPSFGRGKHPAAMGQRGQECWPEIWAVIGPQIEDVMLRGQPSWHENQLIPIYRNGVLEDVYWTYGYSPVYDEGHAVLGTLVVCTETTSQVTFQKELEAARAEAEASRARLTALFSNAPAFVCMLRGPDHVFEMVNPPYQTLIGDSRPLVGRSVAESLPEVIEQGFIAILDGVYCRGEPFVGHETPILFARSSGPPQQAFLTFIYQPRYDAAGAVEGIDVFGFDVTEYVQARQRAEHAAETRRVLAAAIPQQVWTATTAGQLDFVNDRAAEYFGATHDELLGTGWSAFLHPEDADQTIASWTAALSSGQDYEVEFRLRRSDGHYRWHLARAVLLRGGDGTELQWFGTNTDIDEHKRLVETLRLRSDFERYLIGIVSHDLRNPLNVISMGCAVLASNDELKGPHAKTVLRMQSATQRSERLIRDLLDFTEARVGGGLGIVPRPADVFDVAKEVVETAGMLHGHHEFRLSCLGLGKATFDPDRLAQALTNLLANAAQYGAVGEPVTTTVDASGERLRVSVHNGGTPIAPELVPFLFEPLQRGSGGEYSQRSVGLGLYIVAAIARAHGGAVEVKSAESDGTTFSFCLPRHAAATEGP